MKRYLLIFLCLALAVATLAYAKIDMTPAVGIEPDSNGGSGGTSYHYLLIDGSSHYLLIDGASHKMRIDGAQ